MKPLTDPNTLLSPLPALNLTVTEYALYQRKAPRFVGFTGAVGAGKSTAARVLTDRGYRPLSFAASLKEACWGVYKQLGVPPEAFWGTQEAKEKPRKELGGRSGRHVLELVGSEGFRGAYADTFVDVTMANTNHSAYYVIEDVRYMNEVAKILELGGVVIRLVRPNNPNGDRAHISDAWRDLPYCKEIVATSANELRLCVLMAVGLGGAG